MLKGAETALGDAKTQLQEQEKALKTLEINADTIREKMRDFQSKSTFIKNNEEYRAAMTQIDTCKKQIEDIEDDQLLVMEEIERGRTLLALRTKEFKAAESRVAEMITDLDTRLKNCGAQIKKLEAIRSEAIKGVEPAIARRYERLIKKPNRGGPSRRVLVPILEDVCDRCHMNVIAQIRMNARKGMVASCENCGAMLYWES
ncbi:MAG: hypothetical protein HON70_21105 [Lentisphaerae bacterium]|nr:hypothetical protein [Lentisphaerota bacterium]